MDTTMSGGSIDKLNLPELSLGNFTKLVALAFQARMRKYDDKGNVRPEYDNSKEHTMERPMLAIGKPGIGKTEIMRSLLQTRFGLPKEAVVELRLGSMQESDITGMPAVKETGRVNEYGEKELVTKFAELEVLPKAHKNGPYGILVLDELTTCNAAVRSVALQLLDSSRSVGQYKLPNGWMIVALGNGPDDGADYEEIKTTIISRCAGYYVTADWRLWDNWAVSHGIHSAVIGFLRKEQGRDLYNAEGRQEYDAQVANPRTWEITSDFLFVAEAGSTNGIIPDDLVDAVCCSGIGVSVGLRFANFYRFKQSLVPLDEIESGAALTKYSNDNLKEEAMYLAQDIIARDFVRVALECRKDIEKIGANWLSFSKTKTIADDTTPDDKAQILANILNFVCRYGKKDLSWAQMTLETINNVAIKEKFPLAQYLALKNTKIYAKASYYQEFLKDNKTLHMLMQRERGVAL